MRTDKTHWVSLRGIPNNTNKKKYQNLSSQRWFGFWFDKSPQSDNKTISFMTTHNANTQNVMNIFYEAFSLMELKTFGLCKTKNPYFLTEND